MRRAYSATLNLNDRLTVMQKVGFAALLAYLFVLHSRIFELGLEQLRVPSLTAAVAIAVAFITGGVVRAFTHRVGIALLLFTIWMCMAVPFSIWRGRSVEVVTEWTKSLLLFFVIAALVLNWKHFRRVIHLFAFSILVLAVISLLFGRFQEDRLFFGAGRFGNPNDLAQILLMGLPFWWFIITNRNVKTWKRLLAGLATVPIFLTMSKTGSRGALLATAAVMMVLFLRSSLKHKVQLGFLAVVMMLVAASLLPSVIKDRYFIFFKGPDSLNFNADAVELRLTETATSSAWARWQLLTDSIVLTLKNPIFGVGPGNFPVAQDLYARQSRNQKGQWHVTHNTYTEISSEVGIPALFFYLLTAGFAWRGSTLRKPHGAKLTPRQQEMLSASLALRLSLLSYLVAAIFASFAYHSQFLLLAGLAVAFQRTAAREFNSAGEPAEEPARLPLSRVAHPVLLGRVSETRAGAA